MPDGSISPHDPRAADVQALLERHLAFADEHSPPEDVHTLDVAGLLDPSISFFGYRADDELLAIGALRMLDAHHAELKSMHTAEAARGLGIGRALYASVGFEPCPPFGDYVDNGFSVCMTMVLAD